MLIVSINHFISSQSIRAKNILEKLRAVIEIGIFYFCVTDTMSYAVLTIISFIL